MPQKKWERSVEMMAYSIGQIQETMYKERKAAQNKGLFGCFSWLCCRKQWTGTN